MKKLFLTAAAACALAAPAFVAAPAQAEDALSFSGNIALTSDYVFRGITQTKENSAVQGGFDAAYGAFYAGVWASNLDFGTNVDGTNIANLETDVYVGYKPTIGPVAADFGIVGYFYPGAEDHGAAAFQVEEADYLEFYAKGSFAPIEPMTLGGAVYYSPENTGKTGNAWYVEANAGYTITPALVASGAVGWQTVDKGDYDAGPKVEDSYMTWNLGGTYSIGGFGFDLRYIDTDIESITAKSLGADERAVFTIKRAL